jgi:hypothetical protein
MMFSRNPSLMDEREMSKMDSPDKSNGRALFLRYISNGMDAAEHEAMENRLLRDHEFSDEMAACEQELIDAYAVGSLSAAEIAILEPWIALSERRIQQVRMAQAFLQRRQNRAPMIRVWAPWTALAACLLLGAGLLLRTSLRGSLPGKVETPAIVPSQPNLSSSAKPLLKPDVVLLVAERIRGEQQTPAFLIHAASPIQLEVLLATGLGSGYSLKIVRAEDSAHPIFEQSNLEPHSVHGEVYLSSTITAGSLHPGTYDVILSRDGETHISRFAIRWYPSK